jgi:hypothetical protein
MMPLINEAEVQKTWAPIITEATGIQDKSRISWMSKYAHFHNLSEQKSLNESVYNTAHLNPNMNVQGMGAVTLPGDPGLQTAFSAQTPGSGDKPYSLLPLALQVAAQTIGLDLVPVVPMAGPMGILTYLDFVYGGGKIDSLEAPLMIKVPVDMATGAADFVVNTAYYARNAGGTTRYQFTFVGDSRIDGYPIFKVLGYSGGSVQAQGATADETIADVVNGGSIFAAAAGGTALADFSGDAELVKALENHITGFSGRGFANGDVASNDPYSRNEGESTPDNLMGLTLYNKSIAAETYQVAAAVTREQVQDLKQFGIDAVAQVEAVLTNELTQSINKNILERIFRLGATNHANIYAKDGTSLNFVLHTSAGTTNVALGTGEDGSAVTIPTTRVVASTLGGENQGTIQRRVLSKILAATSIISIRGRRGAGNFAVTNGQVATALQDIAGFQPYGMANTFNQNGGSLYPVGSVAGVTVYVDPNMAWSDTRVAVGRKGDGNSTGLVFMPYMMAESVSTIAEGTMAPKIAVKSRYALVDAGHHPETQYVTFKVDFSSANVSLV